VYQTPVPPAPISKREFLKTKASASVKRSSAFVLITFLLSMVLIVASAVAPLSMSFFDIPVVSIVISLIDDEEADPDLLIEELEESHEALERAFEKEEYRMSKKERRAAEEGLDTLEELTDTPSILNFKALLDSADDLTDELWMVPGYDGNSAIEVWNEESGYYQVIDVGTEEEIEQITAGLNVIIVLNIEMFHSYTPTKFFRSKLGNIGISTASGRKPGRRKINIAYSSGKTDPTRMMPDQSAKSAELTDDLISSVGSRQRVYFVYYNKFESMKESDKIIRSVHQHCFK
jgi:hypothetical protein